MKLIALDTLHISEVGPGNMVEGDAFEVADSDGEMLIARGLAAKPKPAAETKPAKAPAKPGKQ